MFSNAWKICRSTVLLTYYQIVFFIYCFDIYFEGDDNITQIPISFYIYKDSRLFQTSQTNQPSEIPINLPDGNFKLRRRVIASQVIAATVEIVGLEVDDLDEENSIVTRFTVDTVSILTLYDFPITTV